MVTLLALSACSEQSPLLPDIGGPQRIVVENPAMCGATTATALIAGQKLAAGEVRVSNDETTVYVTLTTTGGWVLNASHLAVAATLAGIPTNKPGMPEPGRFPLKASHDAGTTTYTYTLPRGALEETKTFYIAAHADVQRGTQEETAWGSGSPFVAKGSWAMFFSATINPCQGVVKGRVIDAETQAPISAAAVKLSSPAELTTAENGTFIFDPVHIGSYVLNVARGAFHPVTIDPVAVAKNQTTDLGDIPLHAKKGVIAGRVLDELSNSPIGGATVAVSNSTGTVQTLTSAADGTFTTDSLRIGAYALLLTDPLHHPLAKEGVAVASLELTNVGDLKLPPLLGEVRGLVTDLFTSSPLGGVAVTLTGSNGFTYSGVTGQDGAFAIGGVRIGAYDAALAIADFDPGALTGVTVAAGAPQDLGTIKLRPHTGFFGAVVAEQNVGPIAGATVRVLDANGAQVALLEPPSQGPATVELRIGSYTAIASASNYETSPPFAFTLRHGVTTGRTFLLEPQKGALHGILVDAETQQSINGTVRVLRGQVVIAQAITTNGVFDITPVRVGTYTLHFTATNYSSTALNDVVVAANATTNVGVVPLAPLKGTLQYQVRQSGSGAAVQGATVLVYSGATQVASLTTGANGNAEALLPVGQYTAHISAPGYVPQDIGAMQVIANSVVPRPVYLVVANGSAQGSVVNAVNGAGISGATVEFLSGSTVITSVVSSGGGAFGPVTLAPGTYTARASASGYTTGTKPVTVNAGATTNIGTIPLSPTMPEGQWRVVLTWGSSPSDLDSHMTGPDGYGGRFHVYYGYKSAYGTSLDWDDVTSYGPETITISTQHSGIYRYSVQNYSYRNSPGSWSLANSGAVVTVYKGNTQMAQYTVPQAGGTLWTVLEINGNVITPINQMSNQSSPSAITKVLRDRQVATDAATINAAVAKNPKNQ